jgi:ABC-type sugar transport system permease subunit
VSHRHGRAKLLFVYSIIVPIVLWLGAFSIFPVLYSLFLSLFKSGLLGLRSIRFVGLVNYRTILFQDSLFWIALRNNGYFLLLVFLLHIPLALALALGLHSLSRRFRSLLLPCYFSPVAAGLIIGVLIFNYLYEPNIGLFNAVLRLFGIPRLHYLADPQTAMPSLFLINLWRFIGFDTVIVLAGLQGIPEQLYESARIDGASNLRVFFRITFPLLGPVMVFLTVTTFVGCMQFFAPVWIIDPEGGPLRSMYLVMLYIFRTAFLEYRITYASAITYIVFVIILLVTLLQLRLGRHEWEY